MIYLKPKITVIFDLGNVVLDWDVDRILKSLHLETEKLNLLRNELFFHPDWLDMDHGTKTEAAVVSKVCQRSPLGKSVVEKALLAAKNSLSPIPESVKLMREMSDKGFDMFCLSNMSRETYDHIKHMELFDMFRGIVISGIERCIKPNKDIFHLILNRYGLEPAYTLFIDDSLPNIESAKRVGMRGYHFKRSRNCYAEIRKQLFQDNPW